MQAEPNVVINSPGQYTSKEGKMTLKITAEDNNFLAFEARFVSEKKGSIGPSKPLAVRKGAWAFSIEGEDKVWFYDGLKRVSLWEQTAEGLKASDS